MSLILFLNTSKILKFYYNFVNINWLLESLEFSKINDFVIYEYITRFYDISQCNFV